MRGFCSQDFSPSCRKSVYPRTHYPSVWHPELVVGLLGAVDRSSAKGKRDDPFSYWPAGWDYVRGFRTLKLEDLHWDDEYKNHAGEDGRPLSLPSDE